MAVTLFSPTANTTTLYPLEMLQHNSIVITNCVIDVTSAVAHTIDVGLYVLDWNNKTIARLSGSTVTHNCATIGVKNATLPGEVTLLPRQQYFVGVNPTGSVSLRSYGHTCSIYTVAGTSLSALVPISSKAAKTRVMMPWVEFLSKKGNEVL